MANFFSLFSSITKDRENVEAIINQVQSTIRNPSRGINQDLLNSAVDIISSNYNVNHGSECSNNYSSTDSCGFSGTSNGCSLGANYTSSNINRGDKALRCMQMVGNVVGTLYSYHQNRSAAISNQRNPSTFDLNDSDEINFDETHNLTSTASIELVCKVCMEPMISRKPTSTQCGHVFCKRCIHQVLRNERKCPICRRPLDSKSLFRLYLNN